MDIGWWLILTLTLFMSLLQMFMATVTPPKTKLLCYKLLILFHNIKKSHCTELILFGGDFNVAPDEYLDRYPIRFTETHYNSILQELCNT